MTREREANTKIITMEVEVGMRNRLCLNWARIVTNGWLWYQRNWTSGSHYHRVTQVVECGI